MKEGTHKRAWYVINGITLYRIVTAPVLVVLLFYGRYELFTWLLALSFFTDLIDGFLARKFKVASVMGTRLDSIGDDLTVLVGVIGLFVMKPGFIKQEKFVFIILFALFLLQVGYAYLRYKKMTGFHTYLAKTAALLQGIFLLVTLFFFNREPNMFLFYTATGITMLQLAEEIIIVSLLPQWESNVKGIYWVIQKKKTAETRRSN